MGKYARKANIEVTYEGVNISKKLSNDLIAFSYKDNLDAFDEVSITVYDKDSKWLNEWVSLKGDVISAKLILNEDGKEEILDCGILYIDDKSYGDSEFTFKAISADISAKIQNEEKTKVWSATTLKKIGSTIASENKLDFSFTGTDVNINSFEQIEKSNGAVLQELCTINGFSVKIINKKLYISEIKHLESLSSSIVVKRAYVIGYPEINETDNDTYDSCIIEYKDHKLNKKVKGEAVVRRTGYKNNTGKVLKINKSFGCKGTFEEITAQLNKIAAGKLREKNKHELSINFAVMGHPKFRAGKKITLEGFGQYNGTYLAQSAEHTKSSSGYITNIELKRCLNI